MARQAVAKVQKTPTGHNDLHRQSARSTSAGHPLLELQRSIGNQAIQRLTSSPFIQAKLQISTTEETIATKPAVPLAVREDDEEEQQVQPSATQAAIPKVTTSVAANIHAMNGGGRPLSDKDSESRNRPCNARH